MLVDVQLTPGDLWDRITIQELKAELVRDPGKRQVARNVLSRLMGVATSRIWPEGLDTHIDQLRQINRQLWRIEDQLRELDHAVFPVDLTRVEEGDESYSESVLDFLSLARSVYIVNGRRTDCRADIDRLCAAIPDVKQYHEI